MDDEKQPARERWPGEVGGPWGAETLMRWLASEGVAASSVGIVLIPASGGWDNDDERLRYMNNCYKMQFSHDLYLLLEALREVDPAKADECADRCVDAAICGDGYGEWTWQWATEMGLDPDAISDGALAAVARIMEET